MTNNSEDRTCVVSVIVPVFNREDIIHRAIQSLLDQDFGESYEIVVVDDGSTDSTAEKVRGIQGNIRLIQQKNAGAASARATGINAAHGKYVAFLDSDDTARPHHLKTLWNAIHHHPDTVASFALCESHITQFERDPNLARLAKTHSNESVICVENPLLLLYQDGCVMKSMNIMAGRSTAQLATAGRDHFLAANDFDFALRLSVNGPFAFAPIQTIDCERREDGISQKLCLYQSAFAVLAMSETLKLSRRNEREVLTAAATRIGNTWPNAAIKLLKAGKLIFSGRVAWAGIRNGKKRNITKRLWWAICAPNQ